MDLNHLKPLVGSPHWHLIEQYLKERRHQFVERLIVEKDDKEAAILRGRLQELDTLLGLASKVYYDRVTRPGKK